MLNLFENAFCGLLKQFVRGENTAEKKSTSITDSVEQLMLPFPLTNMFA